MRTSFPRAWPSWMIWYFEARSKGNVWILITSLLCSNSSAASARAFMGFRLSVPLPVTRACCGSSEVGDRDDPRRLRREADQFLNRSLAYGVATASILSTSSARTRSTIPSP